MQLSQSNKAVTIQYSCIISNIHTVLIMVLIMVLIHRHYQKALNTCDGPLSTCVRHAQYARVRQEVERHLDARREARLYTSISHFPSIRYLLTRTCRSLALNSPTSLVQALVGQSAGTLARQLKCSTTARPALLKPSHLS